MAIAKSYAQARERAGLVCVARPFTGRAQRARCNIFCDTQTVRGNYFL